MDNFEWREIKPTLFCFRLLLFSLESGAWSVLDLCWNGSGSVLALLNDFSNTHLMTLWIVLTYFCSLSNGFYSETSRALLSDLMPSLYSAQTKFFKLFKSLNFTSWIIFVNLPRRLFQPSKKWLLQRAVSVLILSMTSSQ